MKHLAAYLLLQLGGNDSPSAKDIKNLLGAVGIEADDDRLSSLLSELKGKDISEVQHLYWEADRTQANTQLQLISEGSAKLASVPSGGGGGAAPAAGAATGGAAEAPKEEAKEEGKDHSFNSHVDVAELTFAQRRKSPTRTWASVSSTKLFMPAAEELDTLWEFPKTILDDLWARWRSYVYLDHIGMGAGVIRHTRTGRYLCSMG